MDVLSWIVIFAIALLFFGNKKNKANSRHYKRSSQKVWGEPARKQEPTFTAPSTPQPPPQQSPQPTQSNRKIAADGFRYDPDGEWPFQKRKLITATEAVLFERLRQALPDYYIFTQVQLSQLVMIKKGHSFKMWFSRISQMSIDFVIADKFLNTVAAVELDDKSHYTDEERHKADAKKDKVLTAAGIRVMRWRCEIMASVEQIALAFPECKRTVSEPNSITAAVMAELESDKDQRVESLNQLMSQPGSEQRH